MRKNVGPVLAVVFHFSFEKLIPWMKAVIQHHNDSYEFIILMVVVVVTMKQLLWTDQTHRTTSYEMNK